MFTDGTGERGEERMGPHIILNCSYAKGNREVTKKAQSELRGIPYITTSYWNHDK